MTKLVKVSGYVTREEHGDMVQIAARAGSTVTKFATAALQDAIQRFKQKPSLARNLDPDGRRAVQQ